MTGAASHRHPAHRLTVVLASAAMASAFTQAALGAVLAEFAIVRLMGPVTHTAIIAGLCVVGAAILIARRRELSPLRLAPLTLVAFVVWTGLSGGWSLYSAQSLSGWSASAGLAFLAVVIGHVRDTLQTVRALGDVLRVLLTASLAVEVLAGVLLDMPLRVLGVQGNLAALGPLQGIFGTRNSLGLVAVIALITFLVEYRTMSVPLGVSLYSAVVGGLAASLSDSPTVVVLATAVGATAAALALVRRVAPLHRAPLQWALVAVVVVGLGVAYAARHPIIAWIGGARDFSTRADLWAQIVIFVRARPVQGWGWTGTWEGSSFPYGSINYILGTENGSALNAYFDVLLQVGWVGLILFALFSGLALVRSWLVATERRSTLYAWTPLILVTLLVDSVFESFALTGYGWLLLALCALRAGQSRSWRELIDRADPNAGLPPLPGTERLSG